MIKEARRKEFNPIFGTPAHFGKLVWQVKGKATILPQVAALLKQRDPPPEMASDPWGYSRSIQPKWVDCPQVPLNTGVVRQQHRQFAEAYDNAEIVHPSCYGYSFAPKTNDPTVRHPAFFGYQLIRRPAKKSYDREAFISKQTAKNKKKGLAGGTDGTGGGGGGGDGRCFMCMTGKPGCPMCWTFPDEQKPEDYAYEGPIMSDKIKRLMECKPLHTRLTTPKAVSIYRRGHHDFLKFSIKSVPCGPVVKIAIEKGASIAYLHSVFRANSSNGCEDAAILFMPCMEGLYSLDNEDIPETDTLNGLHTCDETLEAYSLKTGGSRVTLLHFQFFSSLTTTINIRHFIQSNIILERQPSTTIIRHLTNIPEDLPGDDLVQGKLCDLLDRQQLMAETIALEEKREDDARNKESLKGEVDKLKAASLGARKLAAEEAKVAKQKADKLRQKAIKAKRKQEATEWARDHPIAVEVEDATAAAVPDGRPNSRSTFFGSLLPGSPKMPSLKSPSLTNLGGDFKKKFASLFSSTSMPALPAIGGGGGKKPAKELKGGAATAFAQENRLEAMRAKYAK